MATVSFEIEILFPARPSYNGRKRPLYLVAWLQANFLHINQNPNTYISQTQWNHRQWGLAALNRGYVAVVYPGADSRDAAPRMQKAYPKSTFALIMARVIAWAFCSH